MRHDTWALSLVSDAALAEFRSSRVADLLDSIKVGDVRHFDMDRDSGMVDPADAPDFDAPSILIHEHYSDKLSISPEDEVRTPFDRCYFEFACTVRDKHVRILVLFVDHQPRLAAINVRKGRWAVVRQDLLAEAEGADSHLSRLLLRLVADARSACVLMESDVLEREVERVPTKLNAARRKRGRYPFNDFHVLKIRPRVTYNADGLEPGEGRNSPRLHIRRGHWRHFSKHKTWIKWQTVGDPSLGRVDKVYSVSL